MKIIRSIIFLSSLFITLVFAACFVKHESEVNVENTKKVVPEIEEETLQSAFNYFRDNGKEYSVRPKIPPDPGEEFFFVLNANLDLDKHDEQIIVIRKKQDADAAIKIAVVDFDSVRNTYSRTWENFTSSTNLRTFDISLKDLVGDHNLEIVCRGMNSAGELTLDVFRKTPSPEGLGLYYMEICRIVSDGSIEIGEIERSEAYRKGQKNGPSFPIFSYTRDRESKNLLDQIKHSYYWQYQQNRYIQTSVEHLPGEIVEEKQLEELFSSSSTKPFEEFLAGPWYLSDSNQNYEILLFLPEDRTISTFSGDVQEMYTWLASFRFLLNRLLIYAENASINSIEKRFSITVKSLNTIDVSIRGDEQWDNFYGRYIKLSEELQNDLLSREQSTVHLSEIELTGLYRNDEGIEIIFEPPYFTWISEDREFSGGFTVISLNKEVLYLKGQDKNGLPTEDAVFILNYSEKQDSNHLYRTLTLIPGLLGVHGVELISDENLIFEQFEIVEKPE